MTDLAFQRAQAALQSTRGRHTGIVLDRLAILCGLAEEGKPDRRAIEKLMETRLTDFPFALVSSTSTGYFRAASCDEINQCLATCRNRIISQQARIDTYVKKHLEEGWTIEAGVFVAEPRQREFLPRVQSYFFQEVNARQ